jgi:hypothetical protein
VSAQRAASRSSRTGARASESVVIALRQ